MLLPAGRVHAFDADAFRLKRLKANCQTAGAGSIVRAKCEDFLKVDPTSPEYAGVRAVLLDPSCSGSGTAGTRGDYLLAAARGEVVGGGGGGGDVSGSKRNNRKGKRGDDDSDADADADDAGAGAGEAELNHPEPDERVGKLAQFQARALSHALKFPSAERVSYSTCSVHALENELVVKEVMPEALKLGYTLEKAIPVGGWSAS